MLHLAISKLLLEGNAELFEARAGLVNIIHSNGNVTKTTAEFGISVGISLEVRVRLRSMVMCQLQNSYYGLILILSSGIWRIPSRPKRVFFFSSSVSSFPSWLYARK